MQSQGRGARQTGQNRFDLQIDAAHRSVDRFGMEAVIYDFAAVPFTPEGALITPSVLALRNMPADMPQLWRAGLYQEDPVQHRVLRSTRPIYWSYHTEEPSALQGSEAGRGPVATYLCDHRLARGVTVSVQGRGQGVATVTGIWRDRPPARMLQGPLMAEFLMMAHALQDEILADLTPEDRMTTAVRLTPRELECLRLCAEGHPDKQVAHLLGRSLSTVVMHLQSVMHKLGARNRAQAVARAAHYGLLGPTAPSRPH